MIIYELCRISYAICLSIKSYEEEENHFLKNMIIIQIIFTIKRFNLNQKSFLIKKISKSLEFACVAFCSTREQTTLTSTTKNRNLSILLHQIKGQSSEI